MTKILAIPALYAINVFWGGFALAVLWLWFMVPLGLPAITYAHAAGLQLLFLMFMASRGIDDKSFEPVAAFIKSALVPLFGLGLGWCTHWIMLHA
jgi:hypothetical protein